MLAPSRAVTPEIFVRESTRYGFILCANVLSSIPEVHVRYHLLRAVRRKLEETGKCLLVSQFRNSYFSQLPGDARRTTYLDGWITLSSRGAFFYAPIDLHGLSQLALAAGLRVSSGWRKGQSAYLLVNR